MTQKIKVEVAPEYLDYQSSEKDQRFVFAYHITITNEGSETAQLLHRHWIITDANNSKREVRGEGVVGEQPVLNPGESFSYTSGVMLETQVGTMQGSYQMQTDDGLLFDADIPVFLLSIPGSVN